MAEGYEFVTVKDLLLRRGVTPEAATVYYSAKNNGINLPADAVGEQAFDESQIEMHWGYAAMKTCLDYGWMTLTDTGSPTHSLRGRNLPPILPDSRVSIRSTRQTVRRAFRMLI